ncbi:MAG TPA: PspA/IM30 family protein [Candidatus Hydrogenedentes bacterium]|nr:PspA/IM30 family protein [Candidatus Hydrogenedentota bacterium]HPG68646.1 PspA/IM30 family protein [Candidatus Hydrogenedentota bacterium]
MLGKFWRAFAAQVNKLANLFWQADPIALMQLEYDNAVEQMKEGRLGLEQYRALVERVGRQVKQAQARVEELTNKVKSYLKAGDRTTAGKFAVELKRATADLEENQSQLGMHEQSYQNYLAKIQNAAKKLSDVQTKIRKYDAELKMSSAEAEMAKLTQSFNFDVTTDFGQLENLIQNKIDSNRARVRVAADLSSQGVAEIEAEKRMEESQAEEILSQFEVDLGLKTPETAGVKAQEKTLGQTAAAEPTAEEKAEALKNFEKQIQ